MYLKEIALDDLHCLSSLNFSYRLLGIRTKYNCLLAGSRSGGEIIECLDGDEIEDVIRMGDDKRTRI